MIRQDLDKLKLPDTPGVYFWRGAPKLSKDSDGDRGALGEILYVGKATNLRDRTRSYFAPDLIKTRGAHIVTLIVDTPTKLSKQQRKLLEDF